MRAIAGLLVVLALPAAVVTAQDYRGEAVPIVEAPAAAELSRFRLLTFTFGREGPMDMPLRSTPVSGREYFVEADVFGIESVATIRFELVDPTGRTLQRLTMWKASDGARDGEFYGFVVVPAQPFRAAAIGTTTTGTPFRSVLADLVSPAASSPAEDAVGIPGLSADQRRQLDSIVAAYRETLRTRAAEAASTYADGVISLSRPVVSPIAYEPFTASSGAPIGVRLRYTIRFAARQTIAAVPSVSPVYQSAAWRGMLRMKPLAGTVTPTPQLAGATSVQDVIRYRANATYEAGVTYTFTVDMVPDYVIQGESGRFCLYLQPVSPRSVFDAIVASQTPVPYSIVITDTGTAATIPAFHPQRVFYESFVQAGATDCGPTPRTRF
jgi:hypothetical protein